MDMVIINSSAKQVAKKIEEDNNWLNQERLEYIIERKANVFSQINFSKINLALMEKVLQKEQLLIDFSRIILNSTKLKKDDNWKSLISKSISKPLTYKIFKNNGILLNFLDINEYENLAKNWLKKLTKDDNIPIEIQKYLTEKQVLSNLNYSIKIQYLSPAIKTKELCLYFINNLVNKKHYQWQDEVYSALPKSLKDDSDIVYLLCENNKPFYRNLSLKAQSNDSLISYVTNKVIRSWSDQMEDEIDIAAITIQELPIEVIRNINNISLIKKIFDNKYSKHYLDEQLQKKWFTKNNDIIFKEYLQYFPDMTKNMFLKELKTQSIEDQISHLIKDSSLGKNVIDQNNPKHAFSFLYEYHNDGDLNKSIKLLNLADMIDKHLELLISIYQKNYKRPEIYLDETYINEKKSLMLGTWLFQQQKQNYIEAACNLLAPIVKEDTTLLENFYLDHKLYKPSILKKNAMKVYEYIDQQQNFKSKNKMRI